MAISLFLIIGIEYRWDVQILVCRGNVPGEYRGQ